MKAVYLKMLISKYLLSVHYGQCFALGVLRLQDESHE